MSLAAALLGQAASSSTAPTAGPPRPASVRNGREFQVDFSRWSGPPLVKTKFGVYQTPLIRREELLRSVALLREAGIQDLRYEMGWGKPDALAFDQIRGTAGEPAIDFSLLDPFVERLRRGGVRPLFAMTYCPLPLQSRSGWPAWKDPPRDLETWRGILRRCAAHYRRKGPAGPLYEIWNEPDMPGDGPKMFFSGGPKEYADLYRRGATGIRAGDPDAPVGGPAIAYDLAYAAPILSAGPVDFVSIHAYENATAHIRMLRGLVRDRPELPILLTEYASFKEFGPEAPVSRHPGAMRFFRDVKELLDHPDTPKVYWAQWADDDMGLVTRGGRRKALFNAFQVYQTLLPVDRNAVIPDGADGIGLLASSDERSAGVVLWNENAEDRSVTVRLKNLPFASGTVRLRRIDGNHASSIDNPAAERLAVNEEWRFSAAKLATSWTGSIPAQSVVFLSLSDGSGRSLLRAARIGTFVRSHYWFPEREEENGVYADFDPRTSIARVGLGRKEIGCARIGAVLDHPARRIRVRVKRSGPFAAGDKNALLGLRVDYGSGRGGYAKSVLWHDGSYRAERDSPLPWGKGGATVDEPIRRPEMRSGAPFVIDIAAKAPGDWNGRILLTPILQNMGSDSRARFVLTPVEPPASTGERRGEPLTVRRRPESRPSGDPPSGRA